MAGARADLSLKIYGDDFAELETLAASAREILRGIREGGDVEFKPLAACRCSRSRRSAMSCAGWALHADEINAVVATAIAGEEAKAPSSRAAGLPTRSSGCPSPAGSTCRSPGSAGERGGGGQVPLSRVADLTIVDRVATIAREDTQRRVAILVSVRGRDTEGSSTKLNRANSRAGSRCRRATTGNSAGSSKTSRPRAAARGRGPHHPRTDRPADLRQLRQRATGRR